MFEPTTVPSPSEHKKNIRYRIGVQKVKWCKQKRGTEFLLKDSLGSPFGVLSPWNEGNNIYKDWCMETTWKQHPKLNMEPAAITRRWNWKFIIWSSNHVFSGVCPLDGWFGNHPFLLGSRVSGASCEKMWLIFVGGSPLILISRVFIDMMQVF